MRSSEPPDYRILRQPTAAMLSLNAIDPDRVPTFKLALHLVQIIFIFVIFCLEINVFVDDDATITGQNGWTFGAVGSPSPKPF